MHVDVIYSRIINYIILENDEYLYEYQAELKLCMNIAICNVHTIFTLFVYNMVGFGIKTLEP